MNIEVLPNDCYLGSSVFYPKGPQSDSEGFVWEDPLQQVVETPGHCLRGQVCSIGRSSEPPPVPLPGLSFSMLSLFLFLSAAQRNDSVPRTRGNGSDVTTTKHDESIDVIRSSDDTGIVDETSGLEKTEKSEAKSSGGLHQSGEDRVQYPVGVGQREVTIHAVDSDDSIVEFLKTSTQRTCLRRPCAFREDLTRSGNDLDLAQPRSILFQPPAVS